MAVNLKKGQGVSLKKDEFDLSKVTIGLGWDVKEEKNGGLFGFLSKQKPEEYDLDVVAFLIGENGKVNDLGAIENGRQSLRNGDIIFFNNLNHHSGQILLTGDNRTGEGDGDDEQIIANLQKLPERYSKILFIVQIYKGKELKQNFSKVQNAFIRAVDAKNREMVRFDLSGDASYANYCSLTFAELVREGNGNWKFNAIGTPHESDSFIHVLKSCI
ncbi:TerD family protein [Thiothrix lacustris]|uniref:TerD family protein n=1 Tax=Thiothrix lacustris TaxID=525917 RepID=UPI0027E42653|nr:TerD family protein [Thiothrix lacustris]WMP18040.1 TerD family protein [Thiothrix lacustris]